MSVLIKGMQMPKEGLSVAVDLWNNGKAYVYGMENSEMYEAVELPDHGRLNDADAMYPYLYDHLDDEHMVIAQLAIDDAPTVIPAERSEDETN